jgi:type IV secretion system protein virB4
LDELWKMLDDPYFEGMIKDWLKTLRKKNALLIGATQDAADIANSNISSTLLTQCQTRIFYANPLAKVADYKPFALTDNEFHFVKNANPNYRMLLIKQENGSVLVNFKLNAMERQIAVISGRTSNLKVMRDCIREVGKNPDDWLPLFYERYTME